MQDGVDIMDSVDEKTENPAVDEKTENPAVDEKTENPVIFGKDFNRKTSSIVSVSRS